MKHVMVTGDIARIEREPEEKILYDTQSALDLIGDTWAAGECTKLILMQEDISGDFFDLKTKIAGEILQKFVNYGFRIAIVGDFMQYNSKSLKDFIYESNQGRVINFVASLESAIAVLA